MGCDLVFKVNGELNRGLFEELPSDLTVTIKDSSILSDVDMSNYSDTFKSVHRLSLLNITKELIKNKTELSLLVEYILNLKEKGLSRSISAKDIKERGIIGNFKYNSLRAKYADDTEVKFPNLRTPYNPDILLVDLLSFNGVSYKDTIFSNDANGNLIYVVTDSPEGVNRLNRHLALRDAIINDFKGNDELEKFIPEFAKAGKKFDSQNELLIDFILRNSDYVDLIPGTYGLLTEITKSLDYEDRIGYKNLLDREFNAKISYTKESNLARISTREFIKFLNDYTPDLVKDLTKELLKDSKTLIQLYDQLNDKFEEFSGKVVNITDDTILIKKKFNSLLRVYDFTYSTIKEQVKHTNEVYKGFHIYQWTDGTKVKYLYSLNIITPQSQAKMFDSVDLIYKEIDKLCLKEFTFSKGFDIGFRIIPYYERVNSIFANKFYSPGSVVLVLNIELDKDTKLNEEEKSVITSDSTLEEFYLLFKDLLTEAQFGLLLSVVDSIETAGIFTYLINAKTGADIDTRNLKEGTDFSDIIQTIADAKDKMDYKMYFVLNISGKDNLFFVDVIPIKDSVEVDEKYKRPKPIIGLINDVVDAFNERFGIGATVLNLDEITQSFPEIPAGTRAFIKDGKIYINGSIATSEDVIHEYTHLILGALKATNYDMYMRLLEEVVNHKDSKYYRDTISKRYAEDKLATPDLYEEIFVASFADFLAGKNPSNIFTKVKEEVDKKMKSIFNLATEEDFHSLYRGRVNTMFLTFSKDIGKIGNGLDFSKGKAYRLAARWISDLIKKNEIIEKCE